MHAVGSSATRSKSDTSDQPFDLSNLTNILHSIQRGSTLSSILFALYTLSKCPGDHPILHRGLKLNSVISTG